MEHIASFTSDEVNCITFSGFKFKYCIRQNIYETLTEFEHTLKVNPIGRPLKSAILETLSDLHDTFGLYSTTINVYIMVINSNTVWQHDLWIDKDVALRLYNFFNGMISDESRFPEKEINSH